MKSRTHLHGGVSREVLGSSHFGYRDSLRLSHQYEGAGTARPEERAAVPETGHPGSDTVSRH